MKSASTCNLCKTLLCSDDIWRKEGNSDKYSDKNSTTHNAFFQNINELLALKIKPTAHRYELDHEEGWMLKNWCFWTVMLEKTLESPLYSKEIKSVNPKGNQLWIFIGRTSAFIDAEAEAPIFGHLMWRGDWLEKTLMLGKIEGRRRRGDRGWWLSGIIDSMDMSWSKLWEIMKDSKSWCAAAHGVTKSWTWLSNWVTKK